MGLVMMKRNKAIECFHSRRQHPAGMDDLDSDSRIGGGMQNAPLDPLTFYLDHLSDHDDYAGIANDLWEMVIRNTGCAGFNATYLSMEQNKLESIGQSTNQSDPEPNWYIYHSDHLGSSAFLTDASGDPTQHLQYMPFGETFVEQRSVTSYYTPYTFSAKERDTETGYSYFGARYYDADISVWLSVDPMADKYPSMSAYMYCAGNPVMLVDPDGRDWFINEITGDVYFNNRYSKDDAGKGAMTGDGWVHFGPNGMFTDDKPNGNLPSAELQFVANNGGKGVFTPTGYIQELMLAGEKAESFMNRQGYTKRESAVDMYTNESHTAIPDPHGTNWIVDIEQTILAVHSWTYAKKRSEREFVPETSNFWLRTVHPSMQKWTDQKFETGRFHYTSKKNHSAFFQIALNIAKDLMNIWSGRPRQKK
jgi:RHS repeat-associated protein